MSYPPSAAPAMNSFVVHALGRDGSSAFSAAATAASALLAPAKVAFWKNPDDENFSLATLTLIDRDDGFETESIAYGEDSLLIAMTSNSTVAAQNRDWIQKPDLWLVHAEEEKDAESSLRHWVNTGAGAVVFFRSHRADWISGNATFGRSQGAHQYAPDVSIPEAEAFGFFTGGVVGALMEELLGENLFVKTTAYVERECLEMRPLHLGWAAQSGLAAASVFSAEHSADDTQGKRRAAAQVQQQLRLWRGPESPSWGGRGR